MKLCICLIVLFFFGQSYGAGTVGEVKTCMKSKGDACTQQCKAKIPSPINADKVVTCLETMKQTMESNHEQCMTSNGITDASPCPKPPTFGHRQGGNGRGPPNGPPPGGPGNPIGQNRLKRQGGQDGGGHFQNGPHNGPGGRKGGPGGPFPELNEFHECIGQCVQGGMQSCTTSCTAPFDQKYFKCGPFGGGPHGGGRGHGPGHGGRGQGPPLPPPEASGNDGNSGVFPAGDADTSVQGGARGRPNRQATPGADASNPFETMKNCLVDAGVKVAQRPNGNNGPPPPQGGGQ